jgi:hypothetical protein
MARERPRAPDNRPLQFSDLTPQGKEVISEQMKATGRAKSNAPEIQERLEQTRQRGLAKGTASGKRTAKNAADSINTLSGIGPRLRDRKVTLASASKRRVDLARFGAERARKEAPEGLGGGSRLRAAGVGWYYDHRGDLDKISREHGIHEDLVVTASAVMSPRNSPDNEKAAMASLAHLHSKNPTLSFSSRAQKELGVGASSRFSDLTEEQAAMVSDASLREHISGVDHSILENYSKGGTKENIAKAVGVVRGRIEPNDAINPHSAPKVWSYRDSIQKAKPGTAEHEEYLGRADNALFQIRGQQRLDLFGLQNSTEGMLSPTKTTAEDTWQGAISSGQQLEGVRVPGNTHTISPAKFVASDKAFTDRVSKTREINGKRVSAHPDPSISATSLVHAYHNEATVRAAAQLSKDSGEIIPSVLAQEVPWTEARRVAGKDVQYNAMRKKPVDKKKELPGQTSLF